MNGLNCLSGHVVNGAKPGDACPKCAQDARRSAYAAVAAMIDECLRARLRPIDRLDVDRGPVREGEAAVLRELETISKAMFAASQVPT